MNRLKWIFYRMFFSGVADVHHVGWEAYCVHPHRWRVQWNFPNGRQQVFASYSGPAAEERAKAQIAMLIEDRCAPENYFARPDKHLDDSEPRPVFEPAPPVCDVWMIAAVVFLVMAGLLVASYFLDPRLPK